MNETNKMEVIEPKVAILGFLPVLDFENLDLKKLKLEDLDKKCLEDILEKKIELNAQETIALSSMMTYKDKNAAEMALRILSQYYDAENNEAMMQKFREKIKKSLIESAGRGHASLSTSAYLGILMYGNSKFVDSMFTGAIFGSSLMPSGRRTGTSLNDIMIPKTIAQIPEACKLYYKVVSQQIITYEELQKIGVSKEEAAKILSYGIRGGGFMVVPLETILSFKQEFEREEKYIPDEGKIIIQEIERELKKLGMDILYWSRYYAARNPFPYPNIFKDPGYDDEISEERIRSSPNLLHTHFLEEKEVETLLRRLNNEIKSMSHQHPLEISWKNLLATRRKIARDFNVYFSFVTETFPSWRVWGEVKRHRTLRQNVESVYAAVERATDAFDLYLEEYAGELSDWDEVINNLECYYVIPEKLKDNIEISQKYVYQAYKSFDAYFEFITKYNIPSQEALYVIPRGLRLRVVKDFDLWNIIDGYIPLRTCSTAEKEMYTTTWKELQLIEKTYPTLKGLLGPKCHAVGFCLENEASYKKCRKVNLINKNYDENLHKKINDERIRIIEEKLE